MKFVSDVTLSLSYVLFADGHGERDSHLVCTAYFLLYTS